MTKTEYPILYGLVVDPKSHYHTKPTNRGGFTVTGFCTELHAVNNASERLQSPGTPQGQDFVVYRMVPVAIVRRGDVVTERLSPRETPTKPTAVGAVKKVARPVSRRRTKTGRGRG
jgi:hypothetical protein